MAAPEKEPAASHHGRKSHPPHAHAEHEHEEGWIVSFADNVLLMMGFFVILLAMNMKPEGAGAAEGEGAGEPPAGLLDFAIAVREAFHNPLDLSSTDPNDQLLIRRMLERTNQGKSRDAAPEGEADRVQSVRPTEWTGEGGFVLFSENSAVLTDEAKLTVKQVALLVAGSHLMVEVRGHASSSESLRNTKRARDLAYSRAWAVGAELTLHGLTWGQIRLVSCGDSEPVIARALSAGEHTSNQRSEILVTMDTMPTDPYSSTPHK